MTARRLRDALWALTAFVLVVAVFAWRFDDAESEAMARPVPRGARELRRRSTDSLRRDAEFIAAHDPFRVDHHPSPVAYRPELEAVSTSTLPPPKPPKPKLALAGIVGGPPWTALLDSVPGHEGSVLVSRGDTLGGLTVRSIGRDTVIVQGADTVWRLIVKRPWQ